MFLSLYMNVAAHIFMQNNTAMKSEIDQINDIQCVRGHILLK